MPSTPLQAIRNALHHSRDLRYSPILPAYLTPGEEPKQPPEVPNSIAFFFAHRPYQSLGKIKPALTQQMRNLVFFTEGLASIIMFDCTLESAQDFKTEMGCSQMEFWNFRDGLLEHDDVTIIQDPPPSLDGMPFDLISFGNPAVDVYVEQISASITTLWAFCGRHFPEERSTLIRIIDLTTQLIARHTQLSEGNPDLTKLRQQNAIISALVELSASLSYSVTQGTSGASPILANRSPFPHHSLLGVAGAICALTKFTRYLEYAFKARSAAAVIKKQYSTKMMPVPVKISKYESGKPYSFILPHGTPEEFDTGGDFHAKTDLPLLVHFSLRHGFKETKFSVTAASESLTAEGLPAWTLMTLSHEIMHSRVRDIFQALFGAVWDAEEPDEVWDTFYKEFYLWYSSPTDPMVPLEQGIRNAVLNFCLATERTAIVTVRRSSDELQVNRDDVLTSFRKHKRLAVELFVHFHDYYFAYACQPKLYVMSLWASWTTVAAPVARPTEYLVRTLATIACGTGAPTREAFDGAVELFQEGIEALESAGMRSPLFDTVRSLLEDNARERIVALFKPAYYLIDQVRRNFASRFIASKIDRLEHDPFAEGSTVANEYSSSIYVYGEQEADLIVSPIRYSLAALVRQLSGAPPIGDLQWLTAWNSIVIASQEVPNDKT